MQAVASFNQSMQASSLPEVDSKKPRPTGTIGPILPFSVPQTRANDHCLLGRAIRQIDAAEQKLEQIRPNFAFQNQLDALGQLIESLFAPFEKFNALLDRPETGSWQKQLLLFVVKLPFQVARNIIRLLYAIVKTALSAVVHPLKAVTKLARYLVLLTQELSRPEVWSKMGIGIVGVSCGQFLMTGNPMAVIGIAIGAALSIGGITIGCIRAAKPTEYLLKQAKEMPQALLTGFCLGLLFGAIQKAQAASTQQPLPPPQPPSPQVETVTINNVNDLFKFIEKMTSSAKETLLGREPTELPDSILLPPSTPRSLSMAANLKG